MQVKDPPTGEWLRIKIYLELVNKFRSKRAAKIAVLITRSK